MIIAVDNANLSTAAWIHSVSWKESHRSFCPPDFVDMHSPRRQEEYLLQKIRSGSRLYMLVEGRPIGIVSIAGSVIEDLYVLPDQQNKGFGTKLLRHAIHQCADVPTLWILENNGGAERLYRRMGFTPTGRRKSITSKLDEIEFALA